MSVQMLVTNTLKIKIKITKQSDLKYQNVNNLYGWAMPKSLPVNIEKLHDLYNNLPFLPERMKIENVKKLLVNLHDEKEFVIRIKNLK